MTRALKRQRKDEGAEATRSDVWFSDGNIVLQIENNQFRVFRSLLELQSPTLLKIFQEHANAKDAERVEGCPVVHLENVSADDARHVLKAVFEPTCVSNFLVSSN